MQNIGTPITIKIPFWLHPVKILQRCSMVRKEVNIPTDWNLQDISLFLERCHWETRLWVDDKEIGMQNTLGTPINMTYPMYSLQASIHSLYV